jgi:hypothetical protein
MLEFRVKYAKLRSIVASSPDTTVTASTIGPDWTRSEGVSKKRGSENLPKSIHINKLFKIFSKFNLNNLLFLILSFTFETLPTSNFLNISLF